MCHFTHIRAFQCYFDVTAVILVKTNMKYMKEEPLEKIAILKIKMVAWSFSFFRILHTFEAA